MGVKIRSEIRREGAYRGVLQFIGHFFGLFIFFQEFDYTTGHFLADSENSDHLANFPRTTWGVGATLSYTFSI